MSDHTIRCQHHGAEFVRLRAEIAVKDAKVARLRAMIESIQWSGRRFDRLLHRDARSCPDCGNLRLEGHADSCSIAKALEATK